MVNGKHHYSLTPDKLAYKLRQITNVRMGILGRQTTTIGVWEDAVEVPHVSIS